jgi:hypothetical protein
VADMLASIERAAPATAAAPRPVGAPWGQTVATAKLAPAPAMARVRAETQPRRRASGCVKAFAGCGILTLVFVLLLVAGIVMLVFKGLPKLINAVSEETKRQNDWAEVARVWKPPPADAGPDHLFPEDVAGERLNHHDTEVDLHYLGIDIAGQHAVYGKGETAVEVFAFRVTALEKEALYKRALEGPKAGETPAPAQVSTRRQNYRVTHGTPQEQLLWYRMSPPDEKGVLWWDKGWLFVARSTSGDDPEPFLREYVTALGGEPGE